MKTREKDPKKPNRSKELNHITLTAALYLFRILLTQLTGEDGANVSSPHQSKKGTVPQTAWTPEVPRAGTAIITIFWNQSC